MELAADVRDEMKERVVSNVIGTVRTRLAVLKRVWRWLRFSVRAVINWGANICKSRFITGFNG